jgi:uncharacterized protein
LDKFEPLITRAEHLIERLEALFHKALESVDWTAIAWRWVMQGNRGYLQAVSHPHQISLENIRFVDAQKAEIVRNTRQFLKGLPANHVLLTGARGTGKSSLIKGLLSAYAKDGLRLIEVERQDLVHLDQIVELVRGRKERFIIFCDDLTFEANDMGYKALKVALDGSIAGNSDNVLIYATSNRKNLMPELMEDNQPVLSANGEIRPFEAMDEKVALAERFGLWLSFYPFDQDEYLHICETWLKTFNMPWDDAASRAALSFSHTRGMRSGRVAYQFARDYAGKLGLSA